MDSTVSVARCASYDEKEVLAALSRALSRIGGLDWVRPGMRVAVKANLMMPKKPDGAATVHPVVAAALCTLLIERGASVVVGDSPGGPYSGVYLKPIYAVTGMHAVERTGARLNDDFGSREVAVPEARVLHSFPALRFLLEADAIVSLCKIKTHGLMAYTGACKNFFGGVAGMTKSELHYRYPTHEAFADMLVDLNEFYKPVLSVADAIVAMEGNGPSGGTPRHMDALLCAKNAHALDLAAAAMMNLTADDVPTLAAAARRGLAPARAEALSVLTEEAGGLAAFTMPDFALVPKRGVEFWGTRNARAAKVLTRLFARRPRVEAHCVGCGACSAVCHAKAVKVVSGRARIDRSRCVRCFCCQEFCPKGAITVHRTALSRLLGR